MNYQQLIYKYNQTKKAFEALYFFSKKIKTIEEYIIKKREKVDFDISKYEKYMSQNKPIERLKKRSWFCSREFVLLENVFCPRNETEILVEVLNKNKKEIFNKEEEIKYIDLCSGSGVIGISFLLDNPKIKGNLLDISKKAIKNIKINVEKYKLSNRCEIINEDCFKHLKENNYSIISANFPYIGKDDPIDIDLLKNDPKKALFAKKNGWEYFEKLLNFLQTNKYWNLVVLECNSLHKEKWNETFERYKEFKFTPKEDINGLLRIISITRNKKN